MESSIAVFLMRLSACELLPTKKESECRNRELYANIKRSSAYYILVDKIRNRYVRIHMAAIRNITIKRKRRLRYGAFPGIASTIPRAIRYHPRPTNSTMPANNVVTMPYVHVYKQRRLRALRLHLRIILGPVYLLHLETKPHEVTIAMELRTLANVKSTSPLPCCGQSNLDPTTNLGRQIIRPPNIRALPTVLEPIHVTWCFDGVRTTAMVAT